MQHAGVDEGGIVKLHGNHLVVLRRGRLFTVAIGSGALTPISSVDAYGPDIDPNGTWYDEMLVSADTIVVIGYSYERGGTEVGLFGIDPAGKLTYRSTYHLRSNDYYSSRNYASRLIGSKLIFYSPLYMYPGSADPFQSFPAVRKWHKGATPNEFRRIVSANQVYKPEHPLDSAYGVALHTVTVCDLASGDFDCKATSVIGPPGRVFYVSPESVYIWLTSWERQGSNQQEKNTERSQLYRMPLDGSSPSALEVSGSPVDQFSFLESDDAHLNVLVRSQSTGDGMWGAENAAGSVALLRVPLSSFSDGSEPVPASSYRRLPTPRGFTFQNRFVGDYLLYGSGSGWGYPQNVEKSRLVCRALGHRRSAFASCSRMEPIASSRWARMQSSSAPMAQTCTSPQCASAISPPWPTSTFAKVRRKANCAATDFSTKLTLATPECSACPSACPPAPDIATCSIPLRRSSSSETIPSTFRKSASSELSPKAPKMTHAAPPASTGTAIPSPSSCTAASSRCSATN